MATDNNNLSRLAAETDAATDERTSELEVLSMDLIPTEEELEMDAKTFSLELDEENVGEISTLQSDLRSKDERISNLQFDIEQLRARWSGLEKEIGAREELTEILQADLNSAKQALAEKDELLSSVNAELEQLTRDHEAVLTSVDGANARVGELEKESKRLTKQAKRDDAAIEDLRKRLQEAEDALPPPDDSRDQVIADNRLAIAELKAYIDGRKEDWDLQSTQLDRLTVELAEQHEVAEAFQKEAAAAKTKIGGLEAHNEKLSTDLKSARATAKEQGKELKQLNARLADLSDAELPTAERLIEEQRGQIARGEQRIAELEAHATRADQYADELREKLSSAFETSNASGEQVQGLERKVEELTAEIDQAEARADDERDRADKLKTANEVFKQELDEEIKHLRAQLGDAQKTISGHQTINEKLKTDLTENKAFKKVLENQLTGYEEAHAEELQGLRTRVSELENELAESQRKVASKDKAVAALLSELANKSKTIESIEEIESAIHDIDNRMSKQIDDRGEVDRERPTRLLVGNIEGQKLRFPLFKDRLTIGRTVQNDIQIRAQYISRRHAVVMTDDDGTKIVDWGSKNGVFVNGDRVSEQPLANGDKVTIGTAEFVYEERARRPAE